MSNKQFWDAAREKVKQGNCDFRGVHFPSEPYPLDGFRGMQFTDEAIFDGAVFEDNVDFTKAIFLKRASFQDAIFNGVAVFSGTSYENNASFARSEFKKQAFFQESIFKKDALFVEAKIEMGSFYDARFYSIAYFSNANFGSAGFQRVIFEGNVRFQGTRFKKQALFPCVAFMRSATFQGSLFEEKADFNAARALESIYFPLPSPVKENRTFIHSEYGETAYRLAKQTAINNGDSIAAAEYQYAELCAIEKAKLKSWRNPEFEQLPKHERAKQVVSGIFRLIVMRILFGYGVRPSRVLASSMAVIFIFAILYFLSNKICVCESCSLPFIQAVFISFSTFTTLGYFGDYQLIGYTRFLVSCEAFLGTLLMSAFLVVLGKKYM